MITCGYCLKEIKDPKNPDRTIRVFDKKKKDTTKFNICEDCLKKHLSELKELGYEVTNLYGEFFREGKI